MTGSINTANNYESQMRWFQTSLQRSDSEGSASSMTSSSSEGSSRSASPNLYGQLLRRESFSSNISDTSYQGDIDSSEDHRPFTRSRGNEGIVSVVQSALVSPLSWVRNLAQNVIDLPFTAKIKNSPKEFSVIDMPKAETTPKASQSSSMKTIFSVAALIGAVVLVGAYFYSSQSSAHSMQLEALKNNHTNGLNDLQKSLGECTNSKVTLRETLEQKCNGTVRELTAEHAQKLDLQAGFLNATWAGRLEQAALSVKNPDVKQYCSTQIKQAKEIADKVCDGMIMIFSKNIDCVESGTNNAINFQEGIDAMREGIRELEASHTNTR